MLGTANNLGNLYKNQGKMAETEAMYLRTLQGKEKAWGADHTSTLATVKNLGNLYKNQGKMAEAGGGGDVCASAARIRECSGSRSSENASNLSLSKYTTNLVLRQVNLVQWHDG
jgi:hypothetical protein